MSQKPAPKGADNQPQDQNPPAPPVVNGDLGEGAGGAPPKEEPVVRSATAEYVVAKGKSITCPRGQINEGEEIRSDWFPGHNDPKATDADHARVRKEAFEHLLSRGFITKNR